jgi:hypothetical protein
MYVIKFLDVGTAEANHFKGQNTKSRFFNDCQYFSGMLLADGIGFDNGESSVRHNFQF